MTTRAPGRTPPGGELGDTALRRESGTTQRTFASPLRGGTPTTLVAYGGHLWFLEARSLMAVPLRSAPQAGGHLDTAAPQWPDTVTAATRGAAGRWVHAGQTPSSAAELREILHRLGITDPDLAGPDPVIRQVHATVYADVDPRGAIHGWHLCEPGSEPTDSGQPVWNTATEQWEPLHPNAGSRVWDALDDVLGAAPTDIADTDPLRTVVDPIGLPADEGAVR
jgi:hypothetical protein